MAMMKARKPKRYAEGGDVDGKSKKDDAEKITGAMGLSSASDLLKAAFMPGYLISHLFNPDKSKLKDDPDSSGPTSTTSTQGLGSTSATAVPTVQAPTMKRGGKVKKMASGGVVKSSRGDGCATKGKTKGRLV